MAFDILTGILSGILSGNLFDDLFGILFCIFLGVVLGPGESQRAGKLASQETFTNSRLGKNILTREF